MPKKITIRTPQGEFASLAQAIRALHCDRTTLLRRLETHPDQYQRVQVITPPRPKPRYERTERGARWPISWSQYRVQDHDVKEEIYHAWCLRMSCDPDQEATAEQFFDEMDQYQSPEDQQQALEETADDVEN